MRRRRHCFSYEGCQPPARPASTTLSAREKAAVLDAMRLAGVHPALREAFRLTSMFVTVRNQGLLPPPHLELWRRLVARLAPELKDQGWALSLAEIKIMEGWHERRAQGPPGP